MPKSQQATKSGESNDKPSTTLDADEGVLALAPIAAPSKRKRLWKESSAGAAEAGDGSFVHTWAEDRGEKKNEFKTGKWTTAEDALILEAFDEYCTEHKLEGAAREALITEGSGKASEHSAVFKHVAARFRTRSLKSIWQRCVRLLHPANHKGALTPAEVSLLLLLVKRYGTGQWAMIGRVMHRLANSLHTQWKRLDAATRSMSGDWSRAELDALSSAVKRLGTRSPDGVGFVSVPWNAVADVVATRSASQCNDKWNRGYGLEALGLLWDPAADAALCRAIVDDGAEDVSEVVWGDLLPGRSGHACRHRFLELEKWLPMQATMLPFNKRVRMLKRDLRKRAKVQVASEAALQAALDEAAVLASVAELEPKSQNAGPAAALDDGSDSNDDVEKEDKRSAARAARRERKAARKLRRASRDDTS